MLICGRFGGGRVDVVVHQRLLQEPVLGLGLSRFWFIEFLFYSYKMLFIQDGDITRPIKSKQENTHFDINARETRGTQQ